MKKIKSSATGTLEIEDRNGFVVLRAFSFRSDRRPGKMGLRVIVIFDEQIPFLIAELSKHAVRARKLAESSDK